MKTFEQRAFSALTVKSVDVDKRVIKGIATTPKTDRMGDVVEPLGVQFKNPMPLLMHHNSRAPVGHVKFDKPTKDGITFEATLADIREPGVLKDRIDEAWQSVKSGLISAVSIGFRAIEYAFTNDGIHFLKSEVFELSLVTIPAQPDAIITDISKAIDSIKAMDHNGILVLKSLDKDGAAIGKSSRPSPGDSGKTVKTQTQENGMKTIAEQIAEFEATRVTKGAELEALLSKNPGETLDADNGEKADELTAELDAIDKHIARLKQIEKLNLYKAKPVSDENNGKTAAVQRSTPATPGVVVKNTAQHKPGVQFARMVKCLALAHKTHRNAEDLAQEIYGSQGNEEIVMAVKAAVAAQSTTNANLGGNLIAVGGVFADFVEFLRPATILGKFGTGNIPSLRNVPFRVPLGGATSGGNAQWVGEGKAKPITNFNFAQNSLSPLKVAAITVATMELLRDASVSAEEMLRDLLRDAVAERLDKDFVDPTKAASAGVSPASITNGVTPIVATGTGDADDVRADFRKVMAKYLAGNNPPSTGVWVMPTMTALSASLLQNAMGNAEFPGLSITGGTLLGLPVIVSDYMVTDPSDGAFVAVVNAKDVYLADEGGVDVSASNEASLQMDDAPTQSSVATVTGTSVVSMFQTNSVAIRAERTINWAKRRADAVALLSEVNWGGAL